MRYLPREYLQAVNLARPSSADAEDDAPLDVGEDETEEDAPDPSLLALVNGRTLLSAWQQAVTLLRAELSPANYTTYLSPARPLSWHPPDRLVIAAPSEGLRDWLASRVGRTVERMLVGILAQEVTGGV